MDSNATQPAGGLNMESLKRIYLSTVPAHLTRTQGGESEGSVGRQVD
jgi:hypothetical protein